MYKHIYRFQHYAALLSTEFASARIVFFEHTQVIYCQVTLIVRAALVSGKSKKMNESAK